MSDSSERIAVPFRIIEEGEIDLIDLRILKKLLDGKSIKKVSEEVKKTEKTVTNRLDAMEKNRLLVKRQAPIVDILRLYNYLFITFVKLHLGAAIPAAIRLTHPITGEPLHYTPAPPSWLKVLEAMKHPDEKLFKKIVRYAFVTMGTEWDILMIISTQSIDEYTRFFSQLQRKGFIEKVWGHTVVSYAGYHYDPVEVPDPNEVEESLKSMAKFLKKQGLSS